MTQQSGSSSEPDDGQFALQIMTLIVLTLAILAPVLNTPHPYNMPSFETTAVPEKQSGRGKSRYVRVPGDANGRVSAQPAFRQSVQAA